MRRKSLQQVAVSLVLLLATSLSVRLMFGAPWSAPSPAAPQGWESDVHAFELDDQAHPPKAGSIVFTGSSSFVRWRTLSEDMKPLPVLNRAFGGSEYTDVNQYAARTVIKYRPPAVVVYAGDNDLAAPGRNTPQSV